MDALFRKFERVQFNVDCIGRPCFLCILYDDIHRWCLEKMIELFEKECNN